MLLQDFEPLFAGGLVFKGGTCLSKVHAAFYRLSEDLDFVFSVPVDSLRSLRRRTMEPVKQHLSGILSRIDCLQITQPLQASNRSRQYSGRLGYQSLLTGQRNFVKVEISLREPILDPVIQRAAATLLLDPVLNKPATKSFLVHTLSFRESYAEKIRAALTRREPAIRDFFDIDYALRKGKLDLADRGLRKMLTKKLSVPGNRELSLPDQRLRQLEKQAETHLKPVLRGKDFAGFRLQETTAALSKLARSIAQGSLS